MPWASGKHRLAEAYAWFLARWARRLSCKELAEVSASSRDTVFRSVRMAVAWCRAHADYSGVHLIGIDERACQRGHRHLTLVYQIDEPFKRLLWVGRDRRIKTLLGFFRWFGAERIVLGIPRDRQGRFDRALIGKYQRRFPGFDDKIIALYARGMSTRDGRAHVGEHYGIEIPPDLVSAVTDAVIEEVTAWQNRPLEPTYALVYFDALRVKIRDEGLVRNKAVYLAIGVTCAGHKDVLGLWIEQTEGAKFWLRVMNELKGRGVGDILIAVVDGLKGFPEAITAAFPDCVVQTCVVHLIRYSMQFASWKERKALAKALRPIYTAIHAEAAEQALAEFEAGPWGQKYPAVVATWRRRWAEVVPFFAFSEKVRRIIYTTNAIESLHSQVRKAIRNKEHFSSDEAATRLIYLALRYVLAKWKRPPKEWHAARTQLAIQFGERFIVNE